MTEVKEIINPNLISENVVFKGYKNGLHLIIPDSGAFELCLDNIRVRLEQAQDFFKGAKVILNIGNRFLEDRERALLIQLIKEYGLNPCFAEETKIKASIQDEKNNQEVDQFRATITVYKTVRSGQRVSFEGNLVIMGDVNPGAEVVATGDIIVLGKLRGTAHAGAEGDQNAQIIAMQLKPVQIRIAGVITRDSESETKTKNIGPEVAKIKDDTIVVERFNQLTVDN